MKRIKRITLFALLPVFVAVSVAWMWSGDAPGDAAGNAPGDPEVGAPAPNFTLPGSDGESYTLEDLQGQYVVLEWLNFGCPYVKRHYNSGNMPATVVRDVIVTARNRIRLAATAADATSLPSARSFFKNNINKMESLTTIPASDA